MQINLIPDNSVTLAPVGFTAAVQAAANIYDQDFSGNYTVNITYGWGTYDNQTNSELTTPNNGIGSVGGVIGSTDVNYATLKNWLTAHATLSDQIAAVASLPASYTALPGNANTFSVSSAQEKALGEFTGSSTAVDGAIGFNDTDASNSNFEGLALCEIGHALGWMTDYYVGEPTILDLFRYSSPGQHQWTGGQAAYFSINGGTTDLANFATSYDYTLFTNISNDPFCAPVTSSTLNLTSLDLEVLNVIGFGAQAHVTPTVNAVSTVSVGENQSIAASSLISSISNPSGDSITLDIFKDDGGGTGHFAVNGVVQPDGQWIIPTSSSDIVQYVGGSSPGIDTLEVGVYDYTTNSYITASTAVTATTTIIAGKANPATVDQEINGLYVALYGIAATQAGVTYWENVLHNFDAAVTAANAISTAISVNDEVYLGQQMTAGSPQVNGQTYFQSLYPTSMTDMAFVQALYQNMSNFIGTMAGDNYWLNLLQQTEASNGNNVIAARESVAGQFVHDFLSNDLTVGAVELGVSQSDYAMLVSGQQALLNKTSVSQYYAAETLASGGAILEYTTVSSPAFAVAQIVVSGITSDPTTVTVALTGIANAVAHQDLSLV